TVTARSTTRTSRTYFFTPNVIRILSYCASKPLSVSADGYSLMSPITCGVCERVLNTGHCGRPDPFGSPFFARLTQYDDILSAMVRSFSDAIASFGELRSGIMRGACRLLKT